MEICVRCSVSEKEIRLFDSIYNGKVESICERCSIIENIPIIKKPNTFQLKNSEKRTIYERMKMISGIKEEEETFFREDKLKELDRNPELEIPEKKQLNLIEHFYWEIMKNRRRKGLSQKQLSETLGESEIAIQMLENGKVPENAENIIRKLEQFFQIKLRKISEIEKIMKIKKHKERPVLLDEEGKELDTIPEPEIHYRVEMKKDSETPFLNHSAVVECEIEKKRNYIQNIEEIDEENFEAENHEKSPSRDFNLKTTDLNRIRIGDLRKIHRRKIEATKQEKIEEQKRIEERQRLIEARKEELRLKKEKESKELNNLLGGTELLRKNDNE